MVYSALTVTKNEDEASLMIHIQIALYTVGLISSFKKDLSFKVFTKSNCYTRIKWRGRGGGMGKAVGKKA
jgi:hypothetical protein